MQARTRLVVAAVPLAALLAFSATAPAAGPLPDQTPTLPALPALPPAPTVGVTPTDGGATVEVGAGDTTLQVGAGPGGATLGTRQRGASPTAGGSDPGVPVSIPGLRPGRPGSSAPAQGAPGGVLFGPSPGNGASARAARAARSERARRGSTSAPGADRSAPRDAAASDSSRALPPFLEFVEKIPFAVRVGIVALAMVALAIWAAWVRQRRRLDRNAFVDPVTGVANAPAFDGLLARELERARRYKRPLALLMLDVSDRRHGRLLAPLDQTLRNVTAAIQDCLRKGDIVARLGPSRFAVVCPEATAASAETLARAIERRLEEMRIHVAVGTAERQATDLEAGHLEARAEAAMTAPPDRDPERSPGRAVLRAA